MSDVIALVVIIAIVILIVYLWKKNNDPQQDRNNVADSNKDNITISDSDDFNMWQRERRDLSRQSVTDIGENLTPVDGDKLSETRVAEIVQSINEEILERERQKNEPRTSDVRYSIEIDVFELKPTFQELLLQYIEEKGISHIDFYKAAWIDRKLFSAISNHPYYKPKKETAVACCFGLKLSVQEAEKLMDAAGYSLSKSILWDVIIRYCIEHKIYNINQVNQILDAHGEKCIGC